MEVHGENLQWHAKLGEPVGGIGFEFTLLPNGKLHGERYDHGGQAGDVVMTKM